MTKVVAEAEVIQWNHSTWRVLENGVQVAVIRNIYDHYYVIGESTPHTSLDAAIAALKDPREPVTVTGILRWYVDNDGSNGDSSTMLANLCRSCAAKRRRAGEYIERAEVPEKWEQGDMRCDDCNGALD